MSRIHCWAAAVLTAVSAFLLVVALFALLTWGGASSGSSMPQPSGEAQVAPPTPTSAAYG